jgi:hypothetical protein
MSVTSPTGKEFFDENFHGRQQVTSVRGGDRKHIDHDSVVELDPGVELGCTYLGAAMQPWFPLASINERHP